MEKQKNNLWDELKRRHVVKVAGVYAVVAWLVVQIADTMFEAFGIPDWGFRFVIILLAIFFPIALIITWAIELTPDGIKLSDSSRATSLDHEAASSNALSKRRNWYAIIFAAAVPTIIFSVILVFYRDSSFSPSEDSATPSTSTAEQEISVAVLPLVNMSAHQENSFFAGGVHEDILTNLSRIEGLKVISRTTAMRYLNSKLSLREIGQELGARYIVEGSVRRIGNHVRITVQLIDAPNDTHIWANNYDRELIDVFATQSAVAKEISNSVHLEIKPDSVGVLNDMPTFSVKAYDLYIKAQSELRSQPQSEDSYQKMYDLLNEAVTIDPDFVEAWAFLNEVLDEILRTIGANGWFIGDGSRTQEIYDDFYDQSIVALKKAYALDPDNLETLLARSSGVIGEEQLLSADRGNVNDTRRKIIDYTIERYPDSALAWYILGWWNSFNADGPAAKEAFQKALELDPFHARIVYGSLAHFRSAADDEMVELLFERLAEISPETGEDTTLAEVSLWQRIQSHVGEFFRTADEQSLAPIKELLQSDELQSIETIERINLKQRNYQVIAIPYNDQILKEIEEDTRTILSINPEDSSYTPRQKFNYMGALEVLLVANESLGNDIVVTKLAERIINFHPYIMTIDNYNEMFLRSEVKAHVILGDNDSAWQIVNEMLANSDKIKSNFYDGYSLNLIAALSHVDVDRAAELTLDGENYPVYFRISIMATFHVYFRKVLIHPDVQQYVKEEGKWQDHLGKFIPEYR